VRNCADVLGSIFLIILGVAVTIGSMGLGLGTVEQLRPGFLPFLCGIALTVLSPFLLFRAWQGRTMGSQPFGAWRRPVTVLIGLVAYVVIFNPFGYVTATALLSMVVLRVFEMKSKWVLIGLSLGIAVGTYVLFNTLLGVELPAGLLDRVGRQ
jgi:putative tricarboxylic transport membrane protein